MRLGCLLYHLNIQASIRCECCRLGRASEELGWRWSWSLSPHRSSKWKVPGVEKSSSALQIPAREPETGGGADSDSDSDPESSFAPKIHNKITSCQSATWCVCVRVSSIQKWHKKLFFFFFVGFCCFFAVFGNRLEVAVTRDARS